MDTQSYEAEMLALAHRRTEAVETIKTYFLRAMAVVVFVSLVALVLLLSV